MKQKNHRKKDLQKTIISWDKNLVRQLIDELPINHEDINKIVLNTHGVLKHDIIRRKYEGLLEYSDLFGLPVWVLMSQDTSQEVMPSVKNELDKQIQSYRISDLEEILNYISVQTKGLTLRKDDRTHVELIVETLKKILERHERFSESWQILFSQNQNQLKEPNDYNSIFNLLFTYNSEVIYRGTLRFYKKSLIDLDDKPSKLSSDSFMTSWFFIKKMIPSANKPRLILSIVDDISTEIFKCQQPHININTENEDEMLFSWNSIFQENIITIPDLTSNFRDRMKDLNSLSISKAFQIIEHFYGNELKITRSDENNKSSGKQTFIRPSRNYNTLDYLLINGYIKEGDHILFKSKEDPSYYEFAEIIISDKKTMLLWRGDIYHFTNLTKKLLCDPHKETTPNYCAKYWYFPDRQYSLFELVNFIKMIYKF